MSDKKISKLEAVKQCYGLDALDTREAIVPWCLDGADDLKSIWRRLYCRNI